MSAHIDEQRKYYVSVIICCWTEMRLQDIRNAVVSVQRQTRPPEEIILVVDGNPQLKETLLAEMDSSVRVILHEGLKGSAAARNAGAEAASGEVIAFLDDDAVAEPTWLEELLSALEGGAVVAGGRAIPSWDGARPPWFPEELNWIVGGTHSGYSESGGVVRNVHAHNMALLRSVFLTVGGFATSDGGGGGMVGAKARGGEEADLCIRISRAFPRDVITYQPAARVWHRVRKDKANWWTLLKRAYGEGFYKAWMSVRARDAVKDQVLRTEREYLRYLVSHSLPSRLARPRLRSLAEAAAIVICIAAVGAGYLAGRLWFPRGGHQPMGESRLT